MTTSDVSSSKKRLLVRQGWEIRDIEPISNPSPKDGRLFSRFDGVYTKLRAWQLEGLSKVVLLDADTLVVSPVDDLFDRPSIAAAPDFFLPDHFNSGVMVLSPSERVFEQMLEALERVPTYDGGDQGFLNEFFPDWYGLPVEHRLPIGYNLHNFIFQFMQSHASLKAALADRVKIIHYTLQKPWLSHPTVSGGASLWWQTYFEVHPELRAEWKQRVHALEDWSFERVVSMLSH